MKNFLKPLLLLMFVSSFLSHCAKPVEEVLKPRLYLTIKDDSGKAVSGATVTLYKHAGDTIITKFSDSGGIVLFQNLDTTLYYWLAKKGCSTNGVSQTTLNRPLEPGVVMYGYSVLSPTGVLKIVTNSPETYKVSDSLFSTRVNVDSPYIGYRKVQSFRLRSAKVSTPGVFKDTLISIRCGDTSIVRIPF